MTERSGAARPRKVRTRWCYHSRYQTRTFFNVPPHYYHGVHAGARKHAGARGAERSVGIKGEVRYVKRTWCAIAILAILAVVPVVAGALPPGRSAAPGGGRVRVRRGEGLVRVPPERERVGAQRVHVPRPRRGRHPAAVHVHGRPVRGLRRPVERARGGLGLGERPGRLLVPAPGDGQGTGQRGRIPSLGLPRRGESEGDGPGGPPVLRLVRGRPGRRGHLGHPAPGVEPWTDPGRRWRAQGGARNVRTSIGNRLIGVPLAHRGTPEWP